MRPWCSQRTRFAWRGAARPTGDQRTGGSTEAVAMFRLTTRRSAVLIAAVCVGLGAGTVLAVQASASGGNGVPTPSVPRPATIKPGARPPVRPMTASGHAAPDVLPRT